jgi:23S rRNA pseudouridine2605 synthase
MTEDHEHEAEAPEQDMSAEPEEFPEDEDELDPATSAQISEASNEAGQAGSEEEAEEEDAPSRPEPKLERLQKILAQAGIASRRHAEELIKEGRVQVNGQVVTVLGTKADPARDHIRVDGKLLRGAERLRYFVLNKPKGYVTTVTDPEGRPTIMEFFSKMGERLYPVGRLDYQSEGLLLVTNDGELANGLTKAAHGVEKTYLVKVSGRPEEDDLDRLRDGVSIERGRPGEGKVRTASARIRQVRQGDNPWYEVVLIEGRNRELRKMFEEIGHHVEKIRRVGYGPLVLDLEPGKLRELDAEEVSALRLAAEGKLKPRRLKTSAMLPREAGRPVEERERSSRSGPRGRKPGFEPRGGPKEIKPFERDDRPRRSTRSSGDRGYIARREGGPPRWQKREGDRSQRSPLPRESGFDRPETDRQTSRGSDRFAARSGGQRPYRGGPPSEGSRRRSQRPYSGRPTRSDRPRSRDDGFETQERPRKPFPRAERPKFEQSEERGSRYTKRAASGGRNLTRGPGSSRNFERPDGRADQERPRREGGAAPTWRGKGRRGPEEQHRPYSNGRGEQSGSRPRSDSRGRSRPSGGAKRNGPRPGGKRPGGPPGGKGRS